MTAAEGPFAPGDVAAERYEIVEVIGHGSSGTVYRANDLHVDTDHEVVALKVIHPELHGDRQIFGRFRREAEILRRLEGPHLCRLLEAIEEDGLLMLALEHVDGPSLDRYLARLGTLPPLEAAAIAEQVCAALSRAHAAGIVHRDLKPSNVLIAGLPRHGEAAGPLSFNRELTARVVDFGLAKIVHGEPHGTALTEHDMIFGTPDYMAPEQVAGAELDGRADIYACGAMLYEMLVGKVPFETPGPLTTMAAHLDQPVPSPAAVCDVPLGLDAVVTRALAKDPGERFATAGDMAEALGAARREAAADRPRDTLPHDIAFRDTSLESDPPADTLDSTLTSHKDELVEAMKGKGAKVRVVVKDAPASDPGSPGTAGDGPTSPRPKSPRPQPSRGGDAEGRLWTVVAVVAAAVAVALGIFLGAR